jgi:hypothetical protein
MAPRTGGSPLLTGTAARSKNQCHNYVRQLILFHPSLCQWSPTPLPLPLPVDLPPPLPGERMDVRISANLDESGTIG